VAQTPEGVAVPSSSGAIRTYTLPGGRQGVLVPNGNGTSTLIMPDGSVQTIPTPR
jgi:hypothetical protein